MTDHSNMKLGKKPARLDTRTLMLQRYTAALPPAPPSADWSGKLADLGIMMNDSLGDCTCAAAGHIVQTWTSQAASQIIVPDSAILQMYEGACGYNPSDPSTDQGGDELTVLNYWRKNPLAGHTLSAFCALDVGDRGDVEDAVYLFGAAYIGLGLPLSAQTQDVWDVVGDGATGNNAPWSWGGHAVPIVSYNSTGVTLITWGALKKATWNFISKYMDEGYALLSSDWLESSGVAPPGISMTTLSADLAAITKESNSMSDPAAPQGQKIDPDEVTVAAAAVKAYVSANLPSWAASYVTDAEETGLATAVVTAIEDWRGGQTI